MRVVLALQRLPRRLAALDPALALARDLDAAVTALFVEDPRLLASAALPVVREVDHWSGEVRELDRPALERRLAAEAGRVERVLRAAARERAIDLTFSIVRDRPEAAARAARQGGDIVVVGAFASAADWPGQGMAAAGLVAVYDDATEAGARAVAAAERLAAAAGRPLVVASSAPATVPGRRSLALPGDGLPAFLRALSPYDIAACVVAEAHAVTLSERFRAFGSGRDCLLVYVE
jgi:nucleotide-binding universal stress UspA family protein